MYEIAATFNPVSMRKNPGENLKAITFYVQYVLEAEELNPLGTVVNQDWTMDLHRDAKHMFERTVFLQADDPDLDTAHALAAVVADVIVLDSTGYDGVAQFYYNELATRVVDGCFPNLVQVKEVIVQGRRFDKNMKLAKKVD